MKEVAASFNIPGDLRLLSNRELKAFFDDWEKIDITVMSGLCSEYIRRIHVTYDEHIPDVRQKNENE